MNKNIKKSVMVFGAVAIAILMTSTVTAVPLEQSKPVMDKVEQNENLKQLTNEQNLKNILISYGFSETETPGIIAQSQTLPYIDNELTITSLDELINLIDMDGLASHFTSVNFANFIKTDEIQDLIESELFLDIYNSDVIQDFIQTDIFTDYMNCDELQILLDNLYGDDNDLLQTVSEQTNQYTSSNLQTITRSEELQTIASGLNCVISPESSITTNSILESNELINYEISIENISVYFAYLLFGIITWIPAIILSIIIAILSAPISFIYWLQQFIEVNDPTPFQSAVFITVLYMAIIIGNALLWPLVMLLNAYWQIHGGPGPHP